MRSQDRTHNAPGAARAGVDEQYGGANAAALRGVTIAYAVLVGVDADDGLPPVTDAVIWRMPTGMRLATRARISSETDG